ncbi:MAG TPA: hypothetical protein VF136_05410 [Methylomirabilota bacterium]|jgi:hypothetical protein
MSIPYGLLALVQERVAGVLERPGNGLLPELAISGKLLSQLRDGTIRTPRGLDLRLGKLLDAADLGDLLGPQDDDRLLARLAGRVGGIAKELLDGRGIGPIADSMKTIFRISDVDSIDLGGILRRQASIAVSFVTTLKNLADPRTVTDIREGWTQYFFSEDGFVTIDDIPIVPPDQLGSLKDRLLESGPGMLKSALSERKADRYVRDLIRVLLEVVGDIRYDDLRGRYRTLLDRLGETDAQTKAVRWFRGVGSQAEAIVTSAVEEAALGVAQFQTNPLIAAAAATYAGTAARKAAQHVFLFETERP